MNFNAEVKEFSFLIITIIIKMFFGLNFLITSRKENIILNQSKHRNYIFRVT